MPELDSAHLTEIVAHIIDTDNHITTCYRMKYHCRRHGIDIALPREEVLL